MGSEIEDALRSQVHDLAERLEEEMQKNRRLEQEIKKEIMVFGDPIGKVINDLNEEISSAKGKIRDHEFAISRLRGKIEHLERECLFKK